MPKYFIICIIALTLCLKWYIIQSHKSDKKGRKPEWMQSAELR